MPRFAKTEKTSWLEPYSFRQLRQQLRKEKERKRARRKEEIIKIIIKIISIAIVYYKSRDPIIVNTGIGGTVGEGWRDCTVYSNTIGAQTGDVKMEQKTY